MEFRKGGISVDVDGVIGRAIQVGKGMIGKTTYVYGGGRNQNDINYIVKRNSRFKYMAFTIIFSGGLLFFFSSNMLFNSTSSDISTALNSPLSYDTINISLQDREYNSTNGFIKFNVKVEEKKYQIDTELANTESTINSNISAINSLESKNNELAQLISKSKEKISKLEIKKSDYLTGNINE